MGSSFQSKVQRRSQVHNKDRVSSRMGQEKESRGFFDLKKQFIFYASYHNDSVNVGIHLLCIWNLVWSGMALQHMLGVFAPAPTSLASLPLLGGVPITLATITTAIYVVSYLMMDPVAGGLGALLMLVLNQWTYGLVAAGSPVAGFPLWQAVLGFHIAAWIAQFVGHGVFEGRAPALLDSWDQAFITAPLFVLLEVLFFFGYRNTFYKECMKEVEQNIIQFKKAKAA